MSNKKSMLTKFIKMFVVIIVVPIFCMNIILNKTYERVLISSYSEKLLQTMEQMAFNIDEEMKRICLLSSTISHDKEMIELITTWGKEVNLQKKFEISKAIDSRLYSLFNYNGDINSVIFFLKDKGFYYYNNSLKVKENEVRQMSWYKRLLAEKGKIAKLGIKESISMSSNNSKNIAVAICPKTLNNTSNIEMVYLEVRATMFNTIYSNLNVKRFGDTLIIDSNGEIVAASNKEWLNKNISQFPYLQNIFEQKQNVIIKKVNDTNEHVSTYFSNKLKWMIVNIIDYDVLTRDMQDIFFMFNVIYIIIISLFILFSILFFREMIIPIKKLVQKMKSVEKGDFNNQMEVKGPKEICVLNQSFNKMIYEIKNLIIKIDLKEKERRKEEIKALQAQINPHFIYNTLNAIRLMAMMSKAEGIKNMTDSFMTLISATFKNDYILIPIREEIEYIESYVYIMQVRYGNHFDMEVFIEENVKDFFIIKMIIQPIVENAILHGLSSIADGGCIQVRGFLEKDKVIIEITDNGIGMTEEEITRIFSEETINSRSFTHLGVMNVNRRIKLNFGDMYGLLVKSKKGKYTTIRIILPKLDKSDGGGKIV